MKLMENNKEVKKAVFPVAGFGASFLCQASGRCLTMRCFVIR